MNTCYRLGNDGVSYFVIDGQVMSVGMAKRYLTQKGVGLVEQIHMLRDLMLNQKVI